MKRSLLLAVAVSGIFLSSIQAAFAFDLEVAEAPSSNLNLTLTAINSAKQSLLVNIYELTSSEITDALLAQINAGISVQIIEEGSPVGGLSAAARGVQSQLAKAMNSASSADRLFEMVAPAKGKRRYRFDHAKYIVVDGTSLLIGSENYSPTGNPVPGSLGNRGWEVFIHDQAITQEYAAIFAQDSDMSAGDLKELAGGKGAQAIDSLSAVKKKPVPPRDQPAAPTLTASAVERITSPDTSRSGLLALLNGATKTIDIEQMTFDSGWKGDPNNRSPLLDAVIQASNRGVRVRVLLNDDKVFSHSSNPAASKNLATIALLQQAGIDARTADLKAMGVDFIHNKGALVDGNKTLISSINWDENSVTNNREAAVLITSPDVNAHYEALFESDWKNSGGKPGTDGAALASPSRSLNDDCPQTIHLVAKIEDFKIHDTDDADYATLAGKKIELDFERLAGPKCMFEEYEPSIETSAKHAYLEIRTLTTGTRVIEMEDYTPTTHKLFSIRAKETNPGAEINAEIDAGLYVGSGPKREKLGAATLNLTINPN